MTKIPMNAAVLAACMSQCVLVYIYIGVICMDTASIIPGVVVYDEKIITWVTL